MRFYQWGVERSAVKHFNSKKGVQFDKGRGVKGLTTVKLINSAVMLINTLVFFEFGDDGLARYSQGFGGNTFIILVGFQGIQNQFFFQAGQLIPE